MQEKFNKLIEVVSQNDKTELVVLNNAVVDNLKSYSVASTVKNKKNWDAAKRGFEQAIEQMWLKYFPEEGKETPTGFKNLSEVHKHLKEQGYKISQSQVYADKSMLPKGENGLISDSIVRKYVLAKGLSNKTPSAREQAASAKTLESKAIDASESARKTRLQNEILERKLGKEIKALFPADAVNFEFSKRAQIFRYALENWAEKMADPIAGIFGADEEVAAKMLDDLGIDKSKAPELAVKIMERQSGFIELFTADINALLHPFSDGTWQTEEMSNLMREWIEERKEKEIEVTMELISLIDSGASLMEIHASFDLTRKWSMC
ncbi:hypothetical protein [Maridesulfovibrio ferrireducens]|uniref:hypothetical protein n=1 Tax=Maridesulfovibrio ferrireducens TaxID=246191 RepID=UPI001A264B3F|nr:hypothetical protein [Maridesulfovibrio ferrireducens]MBI9112270.1 hypothetical protein [Maridesulfovibrio ferrireducens]